MADHPLQVGPYEVIRRLGAGGMGEVYLARDPRLERQVALKMLSAELANDAERLARFRREALVLASMNHPNIATIFGFEETRDGTVALVLEYVEGGSLADRLAQGALELEEALRVCAQIAEALEVAHGRGVVHRDLKPANVMLGAHGLVKVLDFGLAGHGAGLLALGRADAPDHGSRPPPPDGDAPRADGEAGAGTPAEARRLTMHDAVVGTPGYMSPEQVLAGAQDARTDIFAFGCVLWECLCGTPAFGGRDEFQIMAAVLYESPDPARLPERTPARVRELLTRCLEREAENRLADIRAARLELEETLGIRRASALRTGERAATPSNLPSPLTSFVGRERELADCAARLAAARLLTLVGVGGCGKTRLALRVAEGALDQHPDGVWFVDLAPLAESERVLEVLAESVGAREEPGRSLADSVVAHLAPRRALIVLDNCEHVLAACATLVTRLLAACPELRVLATSREGLAIPGEVMVAVPQLAVPEPGANDPEAALAVESVRLFTERATAARPGFALDAASAPIVAEICRRLDGIPLALELAAARVRVLSVEQIRAKLDDRFRLLTGGSRVALPRQQTLLATLQWSYDQLLPAEQRLLEDLAVFAGGWILTTAAAVCEAHGDEFEVLDLLTRLVEKSLVVVGRGEAGEPRYRFLETVRQYALERLGAGDAAVAVRNRHLDVFLTLAEESERHLLGPNQGEWLERLALEQENLLGALAWCGTLADGAERGLRLASAVWRFWSARGQGELGRRALEEALRRDSGTASRAVRAKALVRLGGLALYQNDYAAARPRIEESLALCREIGDRKGVARALSGLAVVATYQGDLAAARAYDEESLQGYRALGEARGEAIALHNLGYLAWREGNASLAREHYEAALKVLRRVRDEETIAMTLAGIASAWVSLGKPEAASEPLAEALGLTRRLEARREGAYALESVATLAAALADGDEAARFLGAAVALREAIGSPHMALEKAEQEAFLAKLSGALGESRLRDGLARGRQMSFEASTDAALSWLAGAAMRRGQAPSP